MLANNSSEVNVKTQSFFERFGKRHLYLARHAAFPIALTPDLLYLLWGNFQTDTKGNVLNIDWIAVADLLLSPLCSEVGHEMYEIDRDTRDLLLEEMRSDPNFGDQRIKELARFMLSYIERLLKSLKISERDFGLAQRWTALSYIYSEVAAHELALELTKLQLGDKTEWVRMATIVNTLATPLKQAGFVPLLTYLEGMRELARGNNTTAEAAFKQLPSYDNRIVIAGVSLTIPEFQEVEWNLNFSKIKIPPLKTQEFDIIEIIEQPRTLSLGSKWVTSRRPGVAPIFTESLDRDVTLEMVQIPAGKFQMGSHQKEGDYREQPQHQVNISSFFLASCPITQAEWYAMAKKAKVRIALDLHPSLFKGNNHPVEHVTWFEAIEFCERLQLYTGRPYRLPSEAEWEYACRAGTTTPFSFGQRITRDVAIYNDEQTEEVEFFQSSNAFGLCGMHGNVWEWCADHWFEDYKNAPEDGTARLVDSRDYLRVIRGGSWVDNALMCRSAYRNKIAPENKVLTIGFRVALSLE